ncbi:MAG TPA: penicillin-binding transpeptidase domain-containing protein [Bryobacteraceae bacterium]|nr:penicillin-binding transpeptidase domain-containing protein [Bryobacteraceae bacterium]
MNNRSIHRMFLRYLSLLLLLALAGSPSFGATSRKRHHHRRHYTAARTAPTKKPAAYVKRVSYTRAVVESSSATRRRSARLTSAAPIIRGGPWTEPTFADSTLGDNVDGEDLEVRRAAVEALGPYNGSVVVVDPNNGRILTMVNQKLALSSGFQPCSTIKVSVALAALSEGLLRSANQYRLFGKPGMTLTYALAHSNNYFFATLGTKLGFETVSRYAHEFGYGEKAGWEIPDEQLGRFPLEPPKNGGVGMLTSFGEEISQTPLQLAALMTALANGGTLYYLQYPRSAGEIAHFEPRLKRHLEIGEFIPAVKPGMRGAVEFGTARRAQQDEPIAGKTGTCTDLHTHLGWFGSFNDDNHGRKLVVVVLLTGGRPSVGPKAAEVAGEVYKNLGAKNYFARVNASGRPDLVATEICCAR